MRSSRGGWRVDWSGHAMRLEMLRWSRAGGGGRRVRLVLLLLVVRMRWWLAVRARVGQRLRG